MMYIAIFMFSVLISSASQIVLKKSTTISHKNLFEEYINFRVILAYAIFFLSSLLTIMAYKGVPLSMGPIIESTGYVWVAVGGHFFLGEKVSRLKLVGLMLIVIGVVVFAM